MQLSGKWKTKQVFLDNDLKEIMSLMQHKIYGTSLEEVNDSIRDIALKYYTTEDEEIVDMEVVINDSVQEKTDNSDLKMCTLSDELHIEDSSRVNKLHTTGTDLEEQTHCKTTESCDNSDNTIIVLVKKIYTDLTSMKERKSQHIVETNRQFSYLHDEITSVKKSAVVHGEITESQFDIIKDTTGSIKVTIENDAKKVQQRFQAIHDSLQNIHDNVKW